jgi:hypothetical protein
VWDVATGRQITLFEKHPHKNQNYRPIQSAVFVADGTQVISAAPYVVGALRWEAETGKILHDFNESSPGNVYLASDGNAVFMKLTGPDNHVRLKSAEDGKIIARLHGHSEVVTGFDYLPDGKHVVTGSRDGTLRLWNIESEREVHRFITDTHTTNVLDVSPDGRYVVSAGGAIQTPGGNAGEFTTTGDFSLYVWRLPELAVEPAQNTSARKQPTVSDSPKPTTDLKVVMYKEGKLRSFPTFGHLKIGLAILANPKKNPPGRKTFRMTIEHDGNRQEFTDPGKARDALLAKLKELDGAGKAYTINGKPAEPRGSSSGGKRKRGGGGFGGGGFGGGSKGKK